MYCWLYVDNLLFVYLFRLYYTKMFISPTPNKYLLVLFAQKSPYTMDIFLHIFYSQCG